MGRLRKFLGGKKTHVVGAAMIVVGASTGDWNQVLLGLGILTGRAAISKVEKAVANGGTK